MNRDLFVDPMNMHNYPRYVVTLQRSGLSYEEKEIIPQVWSVSNAKQALNTANALLDRYDSQALRCSYNTKFFLEALAISAEADIAGIQ